MSHDERFKVLLKEFLREFFELFFPDLVGQLDFAAAVWLQQELITDPPEGEKRTIDLLVSIPLLGAAEDVPPQTVLFHIEVESDDTVEPFRQRMYDYYHHLSRVLKLNVLPIAVYLRVGLEGRGKDVFRTQVLNRTPLTFEYDYVGLPALSGSEYLGQANLLGQALSALMHWPKRERARAAVEAMDHIVGSSESRRRKMLLCDTVNAYAPLDESQRVELTSLLREPERRETAMAVKTWFEEGIEKGIEQGLLTGQRRILLALLEERFGTLSNAARQRLDDWPTDQLTALARALLHAHTLAELGLEE